MKTPKVLTRFSAPRHRSIAELADEFIKDTSAEKEVRKLLKKVNADNLKKIATWADDIKPTMKNKPNDSETKDFLKKFPDTREWHFVDLPIDATGYDINKYKPFIREDDIVHTLMECINILTDNSNKFSKTNALRWLVHLVGDLHQPLHIACSYIDYTKAKPELVFKSVDILKRNLLQKSDKGGNKIILPIRKSGIALHSYWDSNLPEMDNDFSGSNYTAPPSIPKDKLVDMPSQWVSENVKFAMEAYKGLKIKSKNSTHPTYVDVNLDKNAYDKRCIPIVKDLSLKAANRLAFLLRTIYAD